ncbi:c-type cytochrome [uncultured Arcticibacterium sp.]|uniref:c-type cytochrome n=1 Tax=uncultured Arcticibacterium sp. TaxID=2173042 RepID=UPI0030F57BEF
MKKIITYLLLSLFGALLIAICYVKFALPNVPVSDELEIELSPERIERGKYLANHVTLCMDCHAERDFSLLSGPPKPGTEGAGGEKFDQNQGFPGTFYSRNITPHGLSDWTDGEIYRAITSGVTKSNEVIFPVMPWPAYNKMATEDVFSIIAYLRSLKPINSKNKQSSTDFPVSLIKNTFPSPANPVLLPDKTDKINYGKYLTNAAGCIECHSKKDSKGNNIPGTEFGGGTGFPLAGFGTVYAANLTPDPKTGLLLSEKDFITLFKSYTDSTFTPPKVMNGEFQTFMPWMMYGGMTEDDLGAIYAYLKTLPAIKNPVIKFESEEITMK